jgi:GNAT superfamily N-acetyltransferase
MIKTFPSLWKEHFTWSRGVLTKKIIQLKSADIYLGYTPDAWYNFALPKVRSPRDFDLKEIKEILAPANPSATVYLHEKHIKAYSLFLIRNGYRKMGTDTWMVFSPEIDKEVVVGTSVKHIGLSRFADFDKITTEVYKTEGFDDRPYNEICRKTLIGKIKSKASGFSSEFFMIYEGGKPAAGAGLFRTYKIGYFHNDATLPCFRGKGYQTILIKERINYCLTRGIKTMYTIVEYGSRSFKNYQKCGFETWQVANLFTIQGVHL